MRLLAAGTEVVRATALRVRRLEQVLPVEAPWPPIDIKSPEDSHDPTENGLSQTPFLSGLEMRVAKGSFRIPGPAAVWYRATRPIVDGAPLSPLMRAAIAADFCNGTSAVLDFTNGPSSTATSRSAWRASRSANGCCSMPRPGRDRIRIGIAAARLPTATAISAAPCRACCSKTLKEAAMLVVLAEARFDAAQMDKVRAVARPMIEASRAEPGCAGYDYAFDMLEPDLMRVRELWRDEQALKDHFATPHMAAFLKGLRELRPVSVTVKCYELGPERKMPNAG